MTYMDHVPAQARSQLPATCHEGISKRTFLSSRSLKGEISQPMPARIYLIPYFERVDAICSYDAPGLNKSIIETEGYQRTSPKHSALCPLQGSIVGMMLEVPEPTTIVKSRAFGGFAQHDAFT